MEKIFRSDIILKLKKRKASKEYQRMGLKLRTERLIARYEKIQLAFSLAEKKVKDLNVAINAIEEGELKEQLQILKVKAVYKLFLAKLKRDKVNYVKVVLNQSKLNELEVIITTLQKTIENIVVIYMLEIDDQEISEKEHLLINNLQEEIPTIEEPRNTYLYDFEFIFLSEVA